VQGWSRDLVEERTSALRPRPPVEDSSLGRLWICVLVCCFLMGWEIMVGIGERVGKGEGDLRRGGDD
jgi:hypothetical protein